jgi:uncharacterized protein (TIGR03067 family)
MRIRIACLLIAVLPALAPARAADDKPAEKLAALQGTWKLVALESDGKARDLPENPPRWIIKGDKVLYGGTELAGLSADATTAPKCLDLNFREPKRVYEGIYAVEKDTLKVCVNRQTEGVKDRPTSFATQDKPDWRLLVFEREKDAKGDAAEGLDGYVGLALRAEKDRKGVTVVEVIDGAPAKKAGLKKDDVLLKVGGQEVTELLPTVQMIRRTKPGTELTLRVERDGKELDIVVKVGVFPFTLLD